MIDVVAFPGRWLPRVAMLGAHATAVVLALFSGHRAPETSASPSRDQLRVVPTIDYCARDYCGPLPSYDDLPRGDIRLLLRDPAYVTRNPR